MEELPTGTITLLLTDIVGSTCLWERQSSVMAGALARHDNLIAECVRQNGGIVVKSRGEGDSAFAVFDRPTPAILAARDLQRSMARVSWPCDCVLRIRIAVHTGEVVFRDGDYLGPTVNRAARLREIGHGGQVLVSEATRSLVLEGLPPNITLESLGRHRLRDLQLPQTVYQLRHVSLPADFPPLRSLDACPHNLPLQPTRFVGRRRETAELLELMASHRLVTVWGAGGSGKTRFAQHTAAELLEVFSDGTWFVGLSSTETVEAVPLEVCLVLRLREEPGRSPTTTLCQALRSSHTLLVLDNCDHLVEACAALATALVRQCPRVHVLATSRQILGAVGETSYYLPPLSLPDEAASGDPQAASAAEAVELLTDRVRAHVHDFALTPENVGWVVHLCRRVDGLPLALELVAPRLRAIALPEIVRRLENTIDFAGPGHRTDEHRHQTLRAMIDWSYGLLTEPERRLFDRLSIFAGSFSLAAAEQVGAGEAVAPEDIVDLLMALVDKAMVIPVPSAAGEWRYCLLRLFRDFGRESLAARGESGAVARRQVEHLLDTATQAVTDLAGPHHAACLDRVDREFHNVAAALERAATGEDAELALRLAATLWQCWRERGHASEGRAWLERLLAATDVERAPRACLQGHGAAGMLAYYQGDMTAARAHCEASLALARQLAEPTALAKALVNLGLPLAALGRDAEAEALYMESLAIARELGAQEVIAAAAADLGSVAWLRGDAPAAHRFFDEALAARRLLGDPEGLASTLLHMANLAASEGGMRAAETHARESLAIRQRIGDRAGWSHAQCLLGFIDRVGGRYGAARERLEESLAAARDLHDDWAVASCVMELANTALAEGDYAAARDLARESYRTWQTVGNVVGTAGALASLAAAEESLGDPGRAATLFEECLALRRQSGDKQGVADALAGLARLAWMRCDHTRAGEMLCECARLTRETGNRRKLVYAIEGFACLAVVRGRPDLASRLEGAAEAERLALGVPRSSHEQCLLRPHLERARTALGDQLSDTALAAGRRMPMDAVLEEALAFASAGSP